MVTRLRYGLRPLNGAPGRLVACPLSSRVSPGRQMQRRRVMPLTWENVANQQQVNRRM
jgi:hypothetical protein